MEKANQNNRYQVFWQQQDKMLFVGYHDGGHPDADYDPKLHSLVIVGGEKPTVDHPASGGAYAGRARAAPATGGGAGKRAALLPPAACIAVLRPHGRRPGSGKFTRAQCVVACAGKTVAAYLAAGGNPATLANAIKDGWAELVLS